MGLFRRKSSNLSKRSLVDTSTGNNPTETNLGWNDGPSESSQSRPRRSLSNLQEILEEDGIISQQLKQVEDMKVEEKRLQKQFWALSDQLTQSKNETNTLQSDLATSQTNYNTLHRKTLALEEQNRIGNWQLQEAGAQVTSLSTACSEKDQELLRQSQAIKGLSNHNQTLQTRIAELERILCAAGEEKGQDLLGKFDQHLKMQQAHTEIAQQLQEAESSRLDSNRKLQEFESENATLRMLTDEFEAETSFIKACLPQTLRSFLLMRLTEHQSGIPPPQHELGGADENASLDSIATTLLATSLDNTCTPTQIMSLFKLLPQAGANNQLLETLQISHCSVCSKPQFRVTSPNSTLKKLLDEFPSRTRYFSCCFEQVCRNCFKKEVLHTLEFKWWNKLGTLQWFPCPRAECNESPGIRCEADLQMCLEQTCGIDNAEDYVKMYSKAIILRQALENLNPVPTNDILQKAAELSQRLIETGTMHSPFDPRFDSALVNENGCIPDFNPGTIFQANIEHGPSPLPLFLKFLKRQTTPKTCIVCSKSLFEISYSSISFWKSSCREFEGNWMWDILVFPTSEIQHCDHEFEVCKACTAEHLRSAIVSGGASACENLCCPFCRRKLSYQEVQCLADDETIAKYEKFLLLDFLSTEPNFRWCLNPSCSSGQIYQVTPRNSRITCQECDFEMCFNHSLPWHNGVTCEEFDSAREHGDPSFRATQEWIKSNTKPCPSCRTGIQKGEACFHMTCSQCSHQFCWVCLADWDSIRSRGQMGHMEGCFFRTSELRPTGIIGENLQSALRARGNR